MSIINEILWSEHYISPPKLIPIVGTPFYIGALNLLYGLSKSGKSHSLAELLQSADLRGKTVVWLDKDYNINPETLKLLKTFKHANKNVDSLCRELLDRSTLNELIVVFDSLKDFSEGLDSNADAQRTMEYIRRFTKLGATVIVIAHGTENRDQTGKVIGFKLQGNSETIQSKCDCVFKFEHKSSKIKIADEEYEIQVRRFIPERMRISNASTQAVSLYDKNDLINCIHKFIEENEEMTKRELIKKFSSSINNVIDNLENEAYTVKQVKRKKVVHKLSS